MTNRLILILICVFLNSCDKVNREVSVKKSELSGDDYRLFQNTPAWELAKAVWDEDFSKMEEIISKNHQLINFQEPIYGNTLLILTIKKQQEKPFNALLKNKANIHIHNTYEGSSALIEACSSKYYDILFSKELLQYGANVNDVQVDVEKEGKTRTPLMMASRFGRIDFVELLIKKGANINYRNEFNQSALSESIIQKKYEISFYLLQNEADFKQPIFYRPDYSAPLELRDPNNKGKPMYLVDILRENFSDFDTNEYKYKMQIVGFLKSKGIDYRATPIPKYIKNKAREKYPKTWEEYLEKY